MERMIALLLTVCLLLSGCGAPAAPEASPEPTPLATPEPTEAEDLPWTVTRGETEYTGVYTGAVEHMIPHGQGAFVGRSGAGTLFAWDGEWRFGVPAGAGELTDGRLCTAMEGVGVMGVYRGRAEDCVPEGRGEFTSVTAEGVSFTYSGGWKNGLPEGDGTLAYDAEGYYTRTGTFTAGTFTPTWLQALETIGTCEPRFALTEAQRSFLEEHPELWETDDHYGFLNSPYKKDYDRSLTLQGCFETPEIMDQPGWMCLYSLRMIRAYTVDGFEGAPPITCIVAADGLYSMNVRVIFPGQPPYMYRGQRFHVYAMPVGLSEYTTVLGEKQTCLVMVAGDAYFGQ